MWSIEPMTFSTVVLQANSAWRSKFSGVSICPNTIR